MFPHITRRHVDMPCFPRIRGDVPSCRSKKPWSNKFSPHTRGCSELVAHTMYAYYVFPAYAGMFPADEPHQSKPKRFPRIRGDVPPDIFPASLWVEFSPHTRGCSVLYEESPATDVVFPAYAGMFPPPEHTNASHTSFPRIRGDVPCAH